MPYRRLSIHRLRKGFRQARTAWTHRICRLLAEFGSVFPQEIVHLRQALPDVIQPHATPLTVTTPARYRTLNGA